MELRVVTVVLHLVAVAALIGATMTDGAGRAAACLLVVVAGGAVFQLLRQEDRRAAR